ncbi:MAG: prepilin-type N-terminal cleavage/methylation domain-containing protein [Thermacetogeniaceae bacterium]
MKKSGFSLVEVIVALTIYGFVLMMLSVMLVRGYTSYAMVSQQVDVQESLRIAMDKMSNGIRRAQAGKVLIAANGHQITFTDGQGKAGGYRLDSVNRQIEQKFESKWLPVASNISDLSFILDNSNVVAISVSGGIKKPHPDSTSVLNTKVYVGVQ